MPITGIYTGDKQLVENQVAEADQEVVDRQNLVKLDRDQRWLYLHDLRVAISGIQRSDL